MQQTTTYKLGRNAADVLLGQLLSKGWRRIDDPNPYLLWKTSVTGGSLMMYSSGKLVFQGSDTIGHEIENSLNGSAVVNNSIRNSEKNIGQGALSTTKLKKLNMRKLWGKSYIGCDEAGKGEFFGPLVAAACFVPAGQEQEIIELGARDSKKISDSEIYTLADSISKKCKFEVEALHTEEFNKLMAEHKNIGIVLSIAHSRAITRLIDKLSTDGINTCDIVVDKFSKKTDRLRDVLKQHVKRFNEFSLTEEEKAEAYPAVAAASILARYNYLVALAEIEADYDVKLPKGYGHVVEFCRDFLKSHTNEELNRIAKLTYKTAKKI